MRIFHRNQFAPDQEEIGDLDTQAIKARSTSKPVHDADQVPIGSPTHPGRTHTAILQIAEIQRKHRWQEPLEKILQILAVKLGNARTVKSKDGLVKHVDFGPTNQDFSATLRRGRQAQVCPDRHERTHAAFGTLLRNDMSDRPGPDFVHFYKFGKPLKEGHNFLGVTRHCKDNDCGLVFTAIRARTAIPVQLVFRNRARKAFGNRNNAHESTLVLCREPTRYGSRPAQGILQCGLADKRIFKRLPRQEVGHIHFPDHRRIEETRRFNIEHLAKELAVHLELHLLQFGRE